MINRVDEWLKDASIKYRDKTAYEYGNDSISFGELYELSKNIAENIRDYYVGDKPIALIMPKGIETIAAYFGVVLSGHIYAPIDSSLPTKRIKEILDFLDPGVLIVEDEEDYLEEYKDLLLTIEKINEKRDCPASAQSCEKANAGEEPLYIIFTSGSSGIPKGVVTSHISLMTYIRSYVKMMDINEKDIIANQAPLDYIAAIRDIYIPIYTGCKTVLLDKKLFMLPEQLMTELNNRKVTCVSWSSSSLEMLEKLHFLSSQERPRYLNKMCFSGSVLPSKILRVWQKELPNVLYVNQYGPTETTASCTYYIADHCFDEDEKMPIGKPYDNYKVVILNEHNKECTVDEMGEICVSGPAVALGYYKNSEETNRRFVQNPINKDYKEIIYKTGDYGIKDKQGVLWFCGRKDRQIKIMGHRVELDEIESLVKRISGISDAMCVYDTSSNKIGLAYVGNVEKKDVILELKKFLPQYALPRAVEEIKELPTLPNGKKDYTRIKEILL